MNQFVARIQPYVDRPIIDATGLCGNFEWDLLFSTKVDPDGDVGTIYASLNEQAGLKLVPQEGDKEVLNRTGFVGGPIR